MRKPTLRDLMDPAYTLPEPERPMSNVFTVQIRTDNDAFQDGNEQAELARILRGIAARLEAGEDVYYFQTIFDINGNDVGRFALKPEGGR
jgi:hypothetical protein